MNKAFIFPGQGSQTVGMGKDFYDAFPVAKETFQRVDDALSTKLSKIIFEGPEDELTKTVNTQPALMTVSLAILSTIIDQSGKKINELCNFVAGHSLGEYSALAASGAISLEDTAKLLYLRGSSMQNAVPAGKGGMAACMGIKHNDLQELLDDLSDLGACSIANDNVEGQIVVSGKIECIDQIVAISKDTGFKAIKLKVSAPFHSELIADAVAPMRDALEETEVLTPAVPLICNVTASECSDPSEIKANLVSQICGTVRWRETMHLLNDLDANNLFEIGSGHVLSGLAKKSPIKFQTTNISNINELEQFLKQF